MDTKKSIAIVLGGYVNGYSIIRELYKCDVQNIWLIDFYKSLGTYSNKIIDYSIISPNSYSLKLEIIFLYQKFGKIVLFPTADIHLEMLNEIYDEVQNYCFLPFNQKNLSNSLDKLYQYKCCENIDIPCPRTIRISNINDIDALYEIDFPILIKPNKRKDGHLKVFRNLFLNNPSELNKNKLILINFINKGIVFLASEYIPGGEENIFAYTAYRSKKGKVLNDWIGKKLTQFPNKFGVFSSASNEAPEIIRIQGEKIINEMDLTGIVEPEFKLDPRDGQYKLMEINLRSMMWHRVGSLSGVNLQHTQWLDALGEKPVKTPQNQKVRFHFLYMRHEIINLLSRKGYFTNFRQNLMHADKKYFAVYNRGDLKPFLIDLLYLPRSLLGTWLRVLKRHYF
ncbi:hypothetical protein N9D02_01345 [Emcibacteraceae bacterium]|nr:hypothetical protein [Emcibacteraceae bacterium]